jgi:hypothetical protein
METERRNNGGMRVVLVGAWLVLVVMIPLKVQPYAGDHPYLAWPMVIVGVAVFVVAILFMLGRMKLGSTDIPRA